MFDGETTQSNEWLQFDEFNIATRRDSKFKRNRRMCLVATNHNWFAKATPKIIYIMRLSLFRRFSTLNFVTLYLMYVISSPSPIPCCMYVDLQPEKCIKWIREPDKNEKENRKMVQLRPHFSQSWATQENGIIIVIIITWIRSRQWLWQTESNCTIGL